MKHTRLSASFAILGLAAFLGTVACNQGPVDTKDLDQVQEPVVEGPTADKAAPNKSFRDGKGFRHDPAKMIEKLDKNQDGILQLSELPEHKARFLSEADTDKDGALSVAELEAHRTAMKQKMFSRMDKDENGVLTEDEVGFMWKHMQVADADKDGKLTQAELDKAHADGTLRPPRGGRGFHGKHGRMNPELVFEKLDANKNGLLEQSELSELPEHKRSRLESADKNGDKALSKEELSEHFQAQHGKFMKRGPAIDSELAAPDVSPAL